MEFEEIKVGEKLTTRSWTISGKDINLFVAMTSEDMSRALKFAAIHLDDDFARNLGFKARLVPGMMLLPIVQALVTETGLTKDTVFIGMDKVKFVSPVVPGDSVHVEVEVVNKRKTSKGDRGIVTLRCTCKNQENTIVVDSEQNYMYWLKG